MLREAFLLLSDNRLARRFATGAPFARDVALRFVAGETIDDAIRVARELNRAGMTVSLDYLGESVSTRTDARAAADVYLAVLERMDRDDVRGNVSLKLTQMGQDIDAAFLRENVGRVLDRARDLDRFIRFDMESSAYTDRTLEFLYRVRSEGYRDVGAVIQSYLRRSQEDVRRLNDNKVRVRLCKGAYQEPEAVAFQDKSEVDRNFVRLARVLLSNGVYSGIATHDVAMIEATKAYARDQAIPSSSYEFQMLYGVRRDLQRQLVSDGYRLRIYIPFGDAWYPYFMRRLAERPANMLFVANAVLKESPLGGLLGRNSGR